jgi:calcineurin-like phosphoesterase family protein
VSSIAIGDVHGNAAGLRDLLKQLKPEVTEADTVIFLGDYIDRGPDSKGCVDEILAFSDEVPADVVCLIGNHEDWLLRTWNDYSRHSWLIGMDGFVTIQSYSVEAVDVLLEAVAIAGAELFTGHVTLPYHVFFERVPERHEQFFRSLKPYYRNADGIFVHASFDQRIPLEKHLPESLFFGWDDTRFPEAYTGEATVFYGHRNNAEVDANGWPRPRRIGKTIGLDSSRYGVITALRVPDERLFQSRKSE